MNKIRFSIVAKAHSPGMLAIYVNCEQLWKN